MPKPSFDSRWLVRASWLALLGLFLLGLDLTSKWLVQKYIPHLLESVPAYPYGGVGITPNFYGVEISIVHATNKGAVTGLFSQYQIPLLILRCLLIGVLSFYIFFKRPPKAMVIPLVLILAGAVGNVVDVFLYGHVVDMIFFRFWGWPYPIFNIADALICIGVVWLIILSLFTRKEEKKA